MDVSELALKLIILLIPGAISVKLYQMLTIHRKWNSFQFVSNAILFGGASYLLSGVLLDLVTGSDHLDAFWKNLPTKEIPYKDVFWACGTAVVIGFSSSAISHYKLINRLAKWMRVTTTYGDENLYHYFLNSQDVVEVYIRDKQTGLTYHGIVDSYSEDDDIHEIVLRQVAVFDYETSDKLYELDKVYLSKFKNELALEVPFRNLKREENGREA